MVYSWKNSMPWNTEALALLTKYRIFKARLWPPLSGRQLVWAGGSVQRSTSKCCWFPDFLNQGGQNFLADRLIRVDETVAFHTFYGVLGLLCLLKTWGFQSGISWPSDLCFVALFGLEAFQDCAMACIVCPIGVSRVGLLRYSEWEDLQGQNGSVLQGCWTCVVQLIRWTWKPDYSLQTSNTL